MRKIITLQNTTYEGIEFPEKFSLGNFQTTISPDQGKFLSSIGTNNPYISKSFYLNVFLYDNSIINL